MMNANSYGTASVTSYLCILELAFLLNAHSYLVKHTADRAQAMLKYALHVSTPAYSQHYLFYLHFFLMKNETNKINK